MIHSLNKLQASLRLVGLAVVVCLLSSEAFAQQLRIPGTRLNKHDTLIDTLSTVVEKGLESTVAFHRSESNRVEVLGTVVDESGFVVTKASEVSDLDSMVCSLPNGERVGASVVWENEEYDLALQRGILCVQGSSRSQRLNHQ